MSLQAGNIRFDLEYKRIKVMRLTVHPPDGRCPENVSVSAPMRTSLNDIYKFINSKSAWIEKHLEKFRNSAPDKTMFIKDEIHHIWGKPYKLKIIQRNGHTKFEIKEDTLYMYVRPSADRATKLSYLDKWHRRLIEGEVNRIIAKWETPLGIKLNGVNYRKMKTHWGSCNYSKRTIRLNTELAKRSPVYLEYVILHEMVHIIEPSHNRVFYKLLAKHCPDWKTIRKNMNAGNYL